MVEQELFVVHKDQKLRLLEKILEQYHGTVLVFSRTKFGAKKITRVVKSMGHTSAEIHSNRSLAQRREALDGFKNGKYRVLIATDIAARGIDVTGIEVVINFDIPEKAEDYVHRIGRTGRAGLSGRAISFAEPDQGADVRAIERLAQVNLPISKLPELPAQRAMPVIERGPRGGFGGGRGRSSAPRRGGYTGPGSVHRQSGYAAPVQQPTREEGPRTGRDDFGGDAPTPVYEPRKFRPRPMRGSGGPRRGGRR
jgi:ATP-dependent RNA helicase RhlE